jgi:hypothetical protein
MLAEEDERSGVSVPCFVTLSVDLWLLRAVSGWCWRLAVEEGIAPKASPASRSRRSSRPLLGF